MTDNCPACGPVFERWLQAEPTRHAAWRALPRRHLAAGQRLQWPGQVSGAVWFVEQGLLRSHFLDAQGRDHNCGFHAQAQWAGMPPQRSGAVAATVAIEALEPSRVVELSHAALAAWLNQRPELQATLSDALSANLLAMSRRERGLLMHSAEQRYQQFLAEQAGIAPRIALYHVASYLGITNVALSRIRRRIKNRQADPADPADQPAAGV